MHTKNTALPSSDTETALFDRTLHTATSQCDPSQRLESGTLVIKAGSFIRIVILATAMATGVAACVPTQQEESASMPLFRSPPGARVPEGVSEIRKGMHYEEVQRILGTRYEGYTTNGPLQGSPRVDVFTYFEDGKSMDIQVWYEGPYVLEVVYGFDPRDTAD